MSAEHDEETAAPKVGDLPEGLYFGLDEASYHGDVALGSGDIRRLATSPFDFWWSSRFNPNRKGEKLTPALFFGRAVHTAVLEGLNKFREEYAPTDYDGSTRAGKNEREMIEKMKMLAIKREEYDQILLAGTMIRANPHLTDAFDGGASEVSVIWRRDGIKRKARLDYLKPRSTVDLKSIRNARDIDFREACRRRFAESRYDAQAAHYGEGREFAVRFIKDRKVFGDAPGYLVDKIKATGSAFAFVYVFLQVEGAPLTMAMTLSPKNPILDAGRTVIERAEVNWNAFTEKFGLATPWVLAEPPSELDISELPAWFGR
jgi:hypothetical protein